MPASTPSDTPSRTLWHRVTSGPRRTVVLCFAAVFVVTLVLAGRQYFLARARELDLRSHRLELQAVALDVGIRNTEKQMRFLRSTAERLLSEQSAEFDSASDVPLRRALEAQDSPLWSLQVPETDAPVRGIGSHELESIAGLHRHDSTLVEDLKLSRLMSRLLSVQHQMSADVAFTVFVSATGVVVAYPPLPDDQITKFVKIFAESQLSRIEKPHQSDYDVTFDPVYQRNKATDWRLLFGTRVIRDDVVRGAIVFGISQKLVQDYMRATTLSGEVHAVVDAHGTLIASSENTFAVKKESWLKTLPKPWSDLALSMLFKTGSDSSNTRGDFLLYRKLQSADLLLIDYIPAKNLFLAVVGQFSVLFVAVWLLLGFLLWVALLVVDQLLAGQIVLSEQLRELARVDPLTNLANRRRLEADFVVLTQGRHIDRRLSLQMIDVDHFKHVNDTWGHEAGDEVLKHLAKVSRAAVRPQDLVARFGGEEFCILLPDTSRDEATEIAERVRLAIAGTVCLPPQAILPDSALSREIRFTVSIGVAELISDTCHDLESLVAVADRRLYLAKERGRNRVVANESIEGGGQLG
jgi:diguanylate cyclase (GGDEF)-like protein